MPLKPLAQDFQANAATSKSNAEYPTYTLGYEYDIAIIFIGRFKSILFQCMEQALHIMEA